MMTFNNGSLQNIDYSIYHARIPPLWEGLFRCSLKKRALSEAHEYSEIHLVRNLRRDDICCEVGGVDEV